MRLVFDIETDGLEPSVIHCIVAKDIDTSEVHSFYGETLDEGAKFLSTAKELIGHNIMDYDLRVMRMFYPILFQGYEGKVTDTLVLSRLIWPDRREKDFKLYREGKLHPKLIGSHGLKAWGYRIGVLKGDFAEETDWQEFTQEMLEYCKQDVEVNHTLYRLQCKQDFSQDAIDLEHEIHSVCLKQTEFGFPFDEDKAVKLYSKLSARRQEIYDDLISTFGSWWESEGVITPARSVSYKKLDRHSLWENAPFTKIKAVSFNPSSRFHISKCLIDKYGWDPKEFTETGEPKVDDSVLGKLEYPEAKLLAEYLLIQKRLGQLAEGNQAWMKLCKNGKIHGRVTTMGAVTSRCTHQNPNTAQIPSTKAAYGYECRELFHAPKGFKLMGCDVSGLELRVLAHYMAAYDKGAYGKILLEGDIHTANMHSAGLNDRNQAKTFIYALLYGGGDEKIGSIVGKGKQAGASLKNKFFKATPAIAKLREAVQAKAKQGYLKGIDGRLVPIRHSHAALNTLLQSCGAIICKRWVVTFHKLLKEHGYIEGRDYIQAAYVHDELQVLVREELADELGKLCVEAIRLSGQYYSFRIALDGEYSIGANWAETH